MISCHKVAEYLSINSNIKAVTTFFSCQRRKKKYRPKPKDHCQPFFYHKAQLQLRSDTAYKVLVRPQLEYAACAWNPRINRDVQKIEKVLNRASRFVMHDYRQTTRSQDLINRLGWVSLENRRLLTQLSMFYKIKINLVIDFPSCIQPYIRSRRP